MLYLWSILLIIINAFWLALVPFTLPGNWLIIITTALFAWWQRQRCVLSGYTLVIMIVLAFAGEFIEFVGGAGGAKKAGAGWPAIVAAVLGTVFGAIAGKFVLPVLGTIIGACLCAGLAVIGFEMAAGKNADASIRSGIAASAGYLVGSFAKLAIGAILWFIAAVAVFWN